MEKGNGGLGGIRAGQCSVNKRQVCENELLIIQNLLNYFNGILFGQIFRNAQNLKSSFTKSFFFKRRGIRESRSGKKRGG